MPARGQQQIGFRFCRLSLAWANPRELLAAAADLLDLRSELLLLLLLLLLGQLFKHTFLMCMMGKLSDSNSFPCEAETK